MSSAAAAARGKCFLVTGSPGVGKTTLVMRVVESLRASHPDLKARGFYTREVREGSERVGFDVITLDGRCGRLASSTVSSYPVLMEELGGGSRDSSHQHFYMIGFAESLRWPTVGKYKVDIVSFESLALPELQVKDDTELFIIDEVGKMEMYSSSFFPAVLRVLESNVPILASIPIPKHGHEFPGVTRVRNHPGASIFTLNVGNRDSIKEEIYNKLVELLPKHI